MAKTAKLKIPTPPSKSAPCFLKVVENLKVFSTAAFLAMWRFQASTFYSSLCSILFALNIRGIYTSGQVHFLAHRPTPHSTPPPYPSQGREEWGRVELGERVGCNPPKILQKDDASKSHHILQEKRTILSFPEVNKFIYNVREQRVRKTIHEISEMK